LQEGNPRAQCQEAQATFLYSIKNRKRIAMISIILASATNKTKQQNSFILLHQEHKKENCHDLHHPGLDHNSSKHNTTFLYAIKNIKRRIAMISIILASIINIQN